MVANIHAGLGSIGPDRNRARSTLRKILMQDLATSIVNDSRAIHMNVTMEGWRELRAMGHLDDRVAILVDGSPNRPIKNVQFAGTIDIVAEANVKMLKEAAAFAWYMLIAQAQTFSPSPYTTGRKGNKYRYVQSFEMFVSDKRQVKGPVALEKDENVEQADWITIHNYVPYAARIERDKYPNGPFWMAYKALRKKYGKYLAIRFDYVESTDNSIKSTKGRNGETIAVAQPVLRIGQLGTFPNHKPNMNKIIRDRKVADRKL